MPTCTKKNLKAAIANGSPILTSLSSEKVCRILSTDLPVHSL